MVLIPFRATPQEQQLSGPDRDAADSKLMDARQDAREGTYSTSRIVVTERPMDIELNLTIILHGNTSLCKSCLCCSLSYHSLVTPYILDSTTMFSLYVYIDRVHPYP